MVWSYIAWAELDRTGEHEAISAFRIPMIVARYLRDLFALPKFKRSSQGQRCTHDLNKVK